MAFEPDDGQSQVIMVREMDRLAWAVCSWWLCMSCALETIQKTVEREMRTGEEDMVMGVMHPLRVLESAYADYMRAVCAQLPQIERADSNNMISWKSGSHQNLSASMCPVAKAGKASP